MEHHKTQIYDLKYCFFSLSEIFIFFLGGGGGGGGGADLGFQKFSLQVILLFEGTYLERHLWP